MSFRKQVFFAVSGLVVAAGAFLWICVGAPSPPGRQALVSETKTMVAESSARSMKSQSPALSGRASRSAHPASQRPELTTRALPPMIDTAFRPAIPPRKENRRISD